MRRPVKRFMRPGTPHPAEVYRYYSVVTRGGWMAGYSSTPLAQKLGIVSGSQVYAVGAPANYRELLDPVPEGVTFVSRYSRAVDLVHLFFTDSAALAKALRNYRD